VKHCKSSILLILVLTLSCNLLSQKNLYLESQYSFGNSPWGNSFLNDIWGYTSGDSTEYAIVGLTDGFSILNIDSANPLELFRINGPLCIWRDMKIWQNHAYIVHENYIDSNSTSSGLIIADLNYLPDSMPYQSWYGPNDEYWACHNIFIDEKGFAYLFGNADTTGESTLILDLADPKNPTIVGSYVDQYIHDGFARGDTLWASEVYEGQLNVLDVSDPQNISSYGTIKTPNEFCHNVWLSDDNKYAFTTDERRGSFVASFDVSDPADMQELDRYEPSYGDSIVPHNTFYLDGYLITSHYNNGVTMVDAHRPHNLVEVGYYDTSPYNGEGGGFHGCWGVYPYFPSGRFIASDRQNGLYVLKPEYKRASYLEGIITSSNSNAPLPGVQVEIIGNHQKEVSRIDGAYYVGQVEEGVFDIRFTHQQCQEKIIYNVSLNSGQVTQLDVTLNCGGVGIEEIIIDREQVFLPFNNNSYKLEIYDLGGRKITSQYISNQINNINWPSNAQKGLYVLKLFNEQQCHSFKLMY
jgi:choice-of-anchor B domain-containing protein